MIDMIVINNLCVLVVQKQETDTDFDSFFLTRIVYGVAKDLSFKMVELSISVM